MYSIQDYDRPSVAVDSVVFGVCTEEPRKSNTLAEKKLQVLLVKRGEEPYINQYSLPGGFLRPDSTLEDTARKSLVDKTGVVNPTLIPFNNYSDPRRDSRGWIISCAFLALTNTVELHTSSESTVTEAQWFDFNYDEAKSIITLINGSTVLTINILDGTTKSVDLAFDHAQIIYDALQRLRDEVDNHDIIFELLPELFTVSALQQPYEIILGKKTSSQAFRKKMASKIEETDQYDVVAAHRTSKLYRKKR